MSARLTNDERETLFLYNQASKECGVSTSDPALIRKLDALSEKDPCVVRVCGSKEYAEYRIPKRYLKVTAPRQYSDEQRQKMRDRLKAAREAAAERSADEERT